MTAKNLRPEPGDRIVDVAGTLVLEKPSGEQHRGRFTPVVEGQALPAHDRYLVYVRKDGEIYDVTDLRGPSKANSRAYRDGHDRVFKRSAAN